MVTQRDIANALKVSRITVSKALNNYNDISSDMKDKVRRKAEELGYIPHFHAKSLHSTKTHTLGVVVPNLYNSFFAHAIHGILERAKKYNYHVILTVSQENTSIEKENILTLLSMRVDGILIACSRSIVDHSIFETVLNTNTALVFFDRGAPDNRYSFVGINDRIAAFSIVNYAIEAGYKKIGHIGSGKDIAIGYQRKLGFLDSLKIHSIRNNKNWVIDGGFLKDDGYLGMKKILKQKEIPEVVFIANDRLAHGAYEACKEAGLNIPNDIRIIAFGHKEFADMMNPTLSIIDVSPTTIGSKAVDVVIDLIKGKISDKKQVFIPYNIIIQNSFI